MSTSVEMPALGESVTEGTVTRWLKQVGERVEVDEPLLEVSTDKVDTEIPSPVAGVVEQILVAEDETAEVGAALCQIGDGSGASAAPAEQPAEQPAPAEAEASAPAATATEEKAVPSADAPAPAAAPAAAPSGGGTPVKMPALGESVTEGTVTRWLKQVGEKVEVDEPLLEVSTDKVDTEIPSPVAGTVQQILVAEDESAEVGSDLCLIGDGAPAAAPAPAAEAPAAAPPAPEPAAPAAAPEPAAAPAAPAPAAQAAPAPAEPVGGDHDPGAGGEGTYITPLVRKLAKEHGVDLGAITGTGVGGRIRKQDVLDAAGQGRPSTAADAAHGPAASAPAAAPAAEAAPAAPAKPTTVPEPGSKRGTTEKMTRLRKVIAQRMVESLQTSAQLTTVIEVDVTKIAALRNKSKDAFFKREGVKLSFMPFFALAACEALKAYPVVNAQVDGESIVYHGAEHLGIAVDTERGLLVPVIKDAGDLNIAGLARKIAEMAEKTRTNKVGPDELSGGTFTLTNTGSRGALFDTPIINQPQVAILGTGAVLKKPGVVKDTEGNETIGIRSYVYLALSYDHRIVDGADAARFLSTLKARLEEGLFEV